MDYKSLSDLLLVEKVKESNDSFALQELVDRHSGIYNRMISNYTGEIPHRANDYEMINFITSIKP